MSRARVFRAACLLSATYDESAFVSAWCDAALLVNQRDPAYINGAYLARCEEAVFESAVDHLLAVGICHLEDKNGAAQEMLDKLDDFY